MQQHIAQQQAFAAVPDVVKSVRPVAQLSSNYISLIHFPTVHCPLLQCDSGQQHCRDNGCVREWMEQVHGDVLCEVGMARGGDDRASCGGRCVISMDCYSEHPD
jgi:hypothetical protein